MKGKLSTKALVVIILTIVLLGIAITGSILLLNDSGIAKTMEEQNVSEISSVSNTDGEQIKTKQAQETKKQEGEVQKENKQESKSKAKETTKPKDITHVATKNITEPEETTLEQERIISQTTTLSWDNIKLNEELVAKDLFINYQNLNYKVEYYLDGEKDTSLTDKIGGNKKGQIIDTYADKNKIGYKLDKVENLPLTISEKESENIIKVYYTKRTDLTYKVYYKEEGTDKEIEAAKVVDKQTFGTTVTEEAIDIEGYNKVKPTSKKIIITTGTNEATFYYTKRTDLSYKVYYKEEGTEKEIVAAKVVDKQTFGATVTEEAIDIEGYNKVEPTSKEITIEVSGNEINFYYTAIKYKFTVKYYYNGEEDKEAKVEGSETAGTVITIPDKPKEGFTKYAEPVNTEIKASQTENVFHVYYGKPDVEITKTASTKVNYGEDIHYKITITNKGYIGTTVIVTDELDKTTYKQNSSTEPIDVNGNTLSWEIDIPAATKNENAVKTIEFDVSAPKASVGAIYKNIAKFTTTENAKDSSNEVSTKVKEFNVTYDEYKEGKEGTALNIIFIIDNSSSMNQPIRGKSYSNNEANAVAPSDRKKTRLESAKSAIQSFITAQSDNTMTVIKYNTESSGNSKLIRLIGNGYKTTRKIESGIFYSKVYYEAKIGESKVILEYDAIGNCGYKGALNGKKYILGTDGLCYEYEEIQKLQGTQVVGTTIAGKTGVTTNTGLSTAVSDMTIGDLRTSFGTYVSPALDKAKKYIVKDKTNVVIVLSDGAFNDNNYSSKANSLIASGADYIYSVAFGSDANITKLATITNVYEKDINGNDTKIKKVYTADNSGSLLNQFNAIAESASGKTQNLNTNDGKVTFQPASNTIKVTESCPIIGYITGSKTKIFKCTDKKDLNSYGIAIAEDGKTLTWDTNIFISNYPEMAESIKKGNGQITIKYYIPNSNN